MTDRMTAAPLATPRVPQRVSLTVRVLRPLAWLWLKATRFRVEGEMPNLPKFIIVAAPHQTNWDLPHALAAGLHYGLRINWTGKASLFKWPYGGFMRWLGGIPIDRSKRNNAVQQMVDKFAAVDRLMLVIPPEGTRSTVTTWKSGFYHIALGAGVPLVLAFIDYPTRRVGIAQVFTPTGDYDADLAAIQAIYAGIAGERVPQA